MIQDNLKVAIVQSDIQHNNIAANLNHFEQHLKSVPLGTHLVVLPEMFSTGFSMDTSHAEGMDGKTVSWLRNMATQHGFAMLAGVMIEENGNHYNRAVFTFPDGSYKHYDKRHLFNYGNENHYYKAGNERVVVSYLGWRICLQVCYDLRFPVWSRNRNDYDVLVYIASWPDSRQLVWSTLPIARALENQCYVVVSNRVGSDKSGKYAGESRIIDPKGIVAADAELYKEQVISGTLSLSELQRFRSKFNVAMDADEFHIV